MSSLNAVMKHWILNVCTYGTKHVFRDFLSYESDALPEAPCGSCPVGRVLTTCLPVSLSTVCFSPPRPLSEEEAHLCLSSTSWGGKRMCRRTAIGYQAWKDLQLCQSVTLFPELNPFVRQWRGVITGALWGSYWLDRMGLESRRWLCPSLDCRTDHCPWTLKHKPVVKSFVCCVCCMCACVCVFMFEVSRGGGLHLHYVKCHPTDTSMPKCTFLRRALKTSRWQLGDHSIPLAILSVCLSVCQTALNVHGNKQLSMASQSLPLIAEWWTPCHDTDDYHTEHTHTHTHPGD